MTSSQYPLYPTAIIFPVLAFPSWILCIPPLLWQISQRNIAAWSLILWIIIVNFMNSINPLIWPRDNIEKWFNGTVLCDIEVRLWIGCSVGLASSVVMIMRRLAKVMDTSNITIAPSRSTRIREKVLEALWCWGFPVLQMLVYYIVQPMRYYIYAISGCVAPYNQSWVNILLVVIWGPITICVAAYYAGLLVYRLYRYRREFHRLLAARNTTKSRFMRLFTMGLITVLVFLPYEFWILWLNVSNLSEKFDWNELHNPANFNQSSRITAAGHVRADKWGQIVAGYYTFLVFGTGTDAYNQYKRMLCAIGLGKVFPSLNRPCGAGTSTPSSVSFLRSWYTTYASKAKNVFSKNESTTETLPTSTRNDSVSTDAIALTTPYSNSLHPVPTHEPMLRRHPSLPSIGRKPFLRHLIIRRGQKKPILPLFVRRTVDENTKTNKSPAEKSPTDNCSIDIYTQAWATDNPTIARDQDSEGDYGVHVYKEVPQAHHHYDKKGKGGPDSI